MMKVLIAILYLASAASSFMVFNIFNIPNPYMDLPLDEASKFAEENGLSDNDKALLKLQWFVKEFMLSLVGDVSEEDTAVIKEVVKDVISTGPKSFEEIFLEVTKKSPDLGARLKSLFDFEKLAAEPELQAFVSDLGKLVWNFDQFKASPPSALDYIEEFNALSDDAKENIKEKFPAVAEFFTSEATTERLQER
ncbi:unnamed protein product [Cylicocyclus nassatus]|uniref:Fatty-acid and retinol-binding protein 1 n=1 Tax=Cylicocyclus nassatus TaxID=53992 RepID=A0AA36M582_CYLNA|nr:unnamed protein product [Cylicocyclus nassatus]